MMLPSEALNREFVLDEDLAPELDLDQEVSSITTHAVLVGNIGLLLPRGEVSELVDRLPVCKMPNTPEWFSGVSSLRGNITPLFDLHELFGVKAPSDKRRIIVLGTGETSVAFWMDEMPRMVRLDPEDRMTGDPPLPDFIKKHANRFYIKDNQIWIEWNVSTFFASLGDLL